MIKDQKGFSLIEIMVSLAVIMVLVGGVYNLILYSIKITADNKAYVEAIEIANQKMEYVRNLPYDDVGTLTGMPPGVIPEYETVTRAGTFNVHTTVIFYNDAYDGTTTDAIFTDYKIITINVSWTGVNGNRDLSIFSKVIPKTEETNLGYGLLKLMVVNSGGDSVPNAMIHVENSSLLVSSDYVTDLNGELSLPLLPDFEGYEVTASSSGYGIDKTYARDAVNLNPTKPNLSIFEGLKTEESFSIDKLSNFQIRTVSNNLPDNWKINLSSSLNDKTNSAIAVDGSDNYYVAWEENSVSSSTVFLQKYNSAQTAQWGTDATISSSQFQYKPDIAVTNSGKIFVVWQDNSTLLKQTTKSDLNTLVKENVRTYLPSEKLRTAYHKNKINFWDKFSFKVFSLKNIKREVSTSYYKIKTFLENFENKPQDVLAASTANIVQTKISNNVNYSKSMTATFDTAPTAGNVIIAIASLSGGNNFNVPTSASGSFTQTVYSNASYRYDVGMWHKIAGAGEASQITINSGGNIRGGVMILLEVSGLDTADLVDVTASNDQTSGNSNTATTGNTPVSQNEGFAIAGILFADNNFNNPNSSDWTSGSADNWTHQLSDSWGPGRDGTLSVATMNLSAADNQSATLKLWVGGSEERNSVMAVFKLTAPNYATMSAIASQTPSLLIPSSNQYVGGGFSIVESATNRNITDIALTESGTVDANLYIPRVRLFYDVDSSLPYDCDSEVYNPGIDLQFGSSTTFDAADGQAFFSEAFGVNVSLTDTLCVYPVIDVATSTPKDETLEISVNNPSTDVSADAGSIVPSTPIVISGTTVLEKPSIADQVHFRFRNDDGDEASTTWTGLEDYPVNIKNNEELRLRLSVSNQGSLDTGPLSYRLEYAEKVSSCDAATPWNTVPADNSGEWKIYNSVNLTDGSSTTNSIGISDENTTFVAGEVKDTSGQTSGINLTSADFTEIEYAIKPTVSVNNTTYCFRLTNAGVSTGFQFTKYPEVTIIGDNNVYVIYLNTDSSTIWGIKKVNSEMSDTDQQNIKLALTENFGDATTTMVWQDERNGNFDVYAQGFDILGNKIWGSDLQVSSINHNDVDPDIAFDSLDNFYVVWTQEATTSKDVFMQKFDLAGVPLWPGRKAVASSSFDEYNPRIEIDSSDNLFLSWTENVSGTENIYSAKFSSEGTKQWEMNPNKTDLDKNQRNASIAVGGGYLYSSWDDDREGNFDIYSQKINMSGSRQWSDDLRINVNTGSSIQRNSSLIANSSGLPVVSWEDQRDGNYNIYATRYNDPGALIGVPSVPIEVLGTKRIGENPVIYEFNNIYVTDASGYLNLKVEWDSPGYSINIHTASSALNIIKREPIQPLEILPNDNKSMLLYVE